jgi:Holliday junction resolvasome RuvABC ATP-dependent DNA helicase subunit
LSFSTAKIAKPQHSKSSLRPFVLSPYLWHDRDDHAVCAQKDGVGKSRLARLIAREYAAAKWNVKITDLDIPQDTSFNWQARRLRFHTDPCAEDGDNP